MKNLQNTSFLGKSYEKMFFVRFFTSIWQKFRCIYIFYSNLNVYKHIAAMIILIICTWITWCDKNKCKIWDHPNLLESSSFLFLRAFINTFVCFFFFWVDILDVLVDSFRYCIRFSIIYCIFPPLPVIPPVPPVC